jgi:ABC transporter substrate binding protein
MTKFILISAIGFAVSWAALAHEGHEHATGVVRERMELMTDMGKRLLAMSKRLRANKELDRIGPDARAVHELARKITEEFTPDINDNDLHAAFATMVREQIGGFLVANDAFFVGRREQIVAMAARHAIPAMYFLREFAAVGGLMSYGNSLADAFYRVGIFAGRILRGVKPDDLPVEQATKIELVLNLKTAKALGLTVPSSLLGRADEIIE